MGKFDSILLAADWDGTMYTGTEVPAKNADAIRYFQAEGGLFTICSGRFYPFLSSFADQVKPNTYLITLNGACIVHPQTKELLYESTLSPSFVSLLDEFLQKRGWFHTITVYEKGKTESFAFAARNYATVRHMLCEREYYKVLMVSDREAEAREAVEHVNSLSLDGLMGTRSWTISAEILDGRNTKGAALRRVAGEVGAELVVAVGDYENDISMPEAADISYTVANAADAVKAVADRITVSVSEGAIAAIIEDLAREWDNRPFRGQEPK